MEMELHFGVVECSGIDCVGHRTDWWMPVGEVGRKGRIGSLGLADTNYIIHRMDRQQGPTVERRELYSISGDTWNSAGVLYNSMLCGSQDGREFRGEQIHVCVRLRPFTVHLKLSQHC